MNKNKDILQFRISSALKNIIGKELITNDFIAIFELVKNAYDAHATEVKIIFENIYRNNPKIIIIDNGKGMNYDDLKNKWLFVAYSAKKDGTEDSDYRSRIKSIRSFAGAKGIGRFSCDKLGQKLRLITKKDEKNSKTEVLLTDWGKFEDDNKSEFINIGIEHYSLPNNPYGLEHGTVLEIFELRKDSNWDREKIIKLKDSLGKLINPNKNTDDENFNIYIEVQEELDNDKLIIDDRDKVNGKVRNFIFEALNIKTTQIISKVSRDGKTITTSLIDNGTLIYEITERNNYDLASIYVKLYYMNRSAKITFSKKMGVASKDYGSVFLYRNGFRIYPFGEPKVDALGIDTRKMHRLGDRVGSNDLIGNIEIIGDNPNFIETTSRDGGLIKNKHYDALIEFFFTKVIERLENYRKKVLYFGFDPDEYSSNEALSNLIQELADLSDEDDLINIKYGDRIFEKLNEIQISGKSTKNIISSLHKIVDNIGNNELIKDIRLIEKRINETFEQNINISKELKRKDKELKKKEEEVEEIIGETLFLKSIKGQEFDEIVSLMHHIGIFSSTINNYIKGITTRIDMGIEIPPSELKEIVSQIGLENENILSITRFATKANFKMNAESNYMDLVKFIREYVENISKTYLIGSIEIITKLTNESDFYFSFKPLEIIFLIENLINNAKKADASKIELVISVLDNIIQLVFIDNGIGIKKDKTERIFDFGYTTTNGSGLGLYHIKKIVESYNGSITVNSNYNERTKFTITLKKEQYENNFY